MVAWSKVAFGGAVVLVSILSFTKKIGSGFNVVWDLDDTLIKSEHLDTLEDESRKNSIVKMDRYVMEHIDDDIMYFRTYIRPHARWVLRILKFFGVKQWVFTSATVGYMNNIVAFLDPDDSIFESKKLSTSDFAEGVLRKTGKDIRLLFDGEEPDLSRSLLVDDKPKYHKPQPENGILCNVFHHADLTQMNGMNDRELLRIFKIIFLCLFVRDVRPLLIKYQPDSYREYFGDGDDDSSNTVSSS